MEQFLKIERFDKDKNRTFGRMYLEGNLIGFTIEDPEQVKKIKTQTAIWAAVYKLGVRQSPKFSKYFLWSDKAKALIFSPYFNKRNFNNHKPSQELFGKYDDWKPHDLIWVLDVAEFEFVLIHWGNFTTDTEGCLIVGRSIGVISGKPAVLHSQMHYLDIYPEIYLGVLSKNKKIEIV